MSLGGKFNKYGTAPPNLTDQHCQQCLDELQQRVKDLLPVSSHDSNAISDEDALIKFLVARRYDVVKAEEMVRHSVQWRKEFGCEKIFTETFDPAFPTKWPSGFLPSVDREQHPVYMERPDGAHIKELLSQFGVDALFRWHIYCLERQRQAVRRMGSDRISIIVDAGKLTMGLLTNSQAIAFMKKITANDESVYPEGLRHMFVINAPRVVTMGWKMISPWLDPRVREKIHIWGPDFLPHLRGYIAPEQLPAELGGTSPHPIAWLRGVPGQDDALVGGRR
eukprot:RCo028820